MAFAWRRANPIGSFRLLATHRVLLGLAAVNFLGQVAHQVLSVGVCALRRLIATAGARQKCASPSPLSGVCSAVVQGAGWSVRGWWHRLGDGVTFLAGFPVWRARHGDPYKMTPTGPLVPGGRATMALWGLVGPGNHGPDEPARKPVRARSAPWCQHLVDQHRRPDRAGNLCHDLFPRLLDRLPGAALRSGGTDTSLPLLRPLPGRLRPRRQAPPSSVSLQTSQSGFSGLANQGSAQPRSRQWRTIAARRPGRRGRTAAACRPAG